jgi:hypothetical protein
MITKQSNNIIPVVHRIVDDMAGENLKIGPPFNAINSWPSSWKATVITDPFGRPETFAPSPP